AVQRRRTRRRKRRHGARTEDPQDLAEEGRARPGPGARGHTARVGVTEAYVRAQLAGYRAPGQPRTRQEAA
ncbi:hypothetical protein KBZ21_40565, partial [Streptomyces sp. A73]|nr:hypothetical protein [Streptomyces sp. A73]